MTNWTSPSAQIAGDYALANRIDAFVLQWTELNTLNNVAMDGLQGYQDMTTESLSITSRSGTKSALWTGRNINIVVRTVTFFSDNDLYVRSFVTVKNDGPNIITDFYCKFSNRLYN